MAEPSVSVSARIAAPAVQLWELVSNIELLPRFSDELQSVQWIDGDSVRVGARFAGTNTHPLMGTWTTQSHIVECEPPRVLAWAVGNPEEPAATWRFELVADGAETDVRYTACIGPGRSGVSMLVAREPHRRDDIVANRLSQFERGMTATLAGIKELAEAGGRGSTSS
ncbi:SRPBCC family protein [Mycolicibacterium arenosum]|uniref:SRPBCC family protein n=1 Tax=Mycolicibacterium arenosum TaxID=2952157 RepID=A0ABT1LVH9_9MYCO|nr:SRPBCC family protein [Mycolicibacterium sp. CAU 1645]MCP9270904.1 SRPBCC family protein [Mycolicibacterium sp. CAU 1645]